MRSPTALLPAALLLACAAEPPPRAFDRAPDTADSPFDHDLYVRSVWKETGDTAGKQFIAMMDDDIYSFDGHVVLYGQKNGTLRVRDFEGGPYPREGGQFKSRDNFYSMDIHFASETEMTVTLVGLTGLTHELHYSRQELDGALIAGAKEAAAKYYAAFDELRSRPVETLADFKKHVALHLRTHGYDPNDHYDAPAFQFETVWLQIESEITLSEPNPALAGVEIAEDGSDAVTADFLQGHPLTPLDELEDPQDVYESVDWAVEDAPEFYVAVPEIEGVEAGPIRDGLEKFATHTFKVLRPFECSDHYDWAPVYHWYLSDGSRLRYWPGLECD